MTIVFTVFSVLGIASLAGSWAILRRDPDDHDNANTLAWLGPVLCIAAAAGITLTLDTVTSKWAIYTGSLVLGSMAALIYIRWRIANYIEVRSQYEQR